jgi:hypothetical protein
MITALYGLLGLATAVASGQQVVHLGLELVGDSQDTFVSMYEVAGRGAFATEINGVI